MATDVKPTVPMSAFEKYLPLKIIGKGDDGIILLAIERKGAVPARTTVKIENSAPALRAQLVALKVVDPEKRGIVTSRFLDQLKSAQNDPEYPLASFLDNDPGLAWYTMSYVSGLSVQQLLVTSGLLPPFLLFHVFVQLCQAQFHLKTRGLCHIDLKQGGNVILRPGEDEGGLPDVILVDFGGVKSYNASRDWKICEHVLFFVSRAAGGQRRVDGGGRAVASETDVGQADQFLEYVHAYVESGVEERWTWSLEVVWEKWGGIAKHLGEAFRDDRVVRELETVLREPVIGNGELQECIGRGGLELELSLFE
ncbi:hypothetical protein BU26DRAFT_570493 [Trematosphaeria pertusa]|uniref:Protein kinase domain-containing protein n=1 Tax=Trematosphaeria pertusa TaxID=390896 RepID=A0A6A6HZ90_9PLEO|nr:uncharacterized protein BU26DRAFT_570493 [Trematosphaeria pertusa]KAF2243088.1 hypothetical protein BU26DRAFT_570493 [Trematosphaeria pertusa]